MSRFAVALLTGLFLFAPAAQAAGPVATRAVLAREMRRAGTFSGADVVDLDSGAVLYARKATTPRMPASIEKLYTSATALLRYGAAGRLTTTVLASALPGADGTIEGDLALRGGGDPTFAPADVDGLADRLVQGGLRRLDGRVIGDESLFDAFRGVPASNFQLTNEVGPLSALAYNHGRTGAGRPHYQSSPAQFTADALSRALKRRGVKVTGRARAGLAATGMLPLSRWES